MIIVEDCVFIFLLVLVNNGINVVKVIIFFRIFFCVVIILFVILFVSSKINN